MKRATGNMRQYENVQHFYQVSPKRRRELEKKKKLPKNNA
jgi:hypothetical protein